MQTLSDAASYRSASGTCSIAEYIVGTPSNTVTRSRSMISSAWVGSKRAISDSIAPDATAAFIAQVWPNAWNSGSAPRTTSSECRPSRSIATCTLRPRLSCVSSAPFGFPVVPDVYRITAVSSPATSTTSPAGSTEPSRRSNAPGVTTIASTPAAAAPCSASAANPCQTNNRSASESER